MDIAKLDENMAVKDPERDLLWYDAKKLTIEGKGWDDTEEFFDRIPARSKDVVRETIWLLAKHSAGISVRFTTDAPSLAVRWDGDKAMDHMPATGVSGVDLYVKREGEWKWLAIGRPIEEMNEKELFSDLPVEEREFMLYLPLYNAVHTVELGLPSGHGIQPAPPRDKKPIVFYGTSITQGGCASRPGMCYTAILGRWLDWPTINLGFSGGGIMEPEVIDLLCELDPAVYVLDNMPNMQEERINEFEEPALRKLKAAHPDVPIVLVDNILYCDAYLKSKRMDRYSKSNQAQYAIYEKLVAEGMAGLVYVKDGGLIGTDGEATVDGTHFTDLGYMRFAEKLVGVLKDSLLNP